MAIPHIRTVFPEEWFYVSAPFPNSPPSHLLRYLKRSCFMDQVVSFRLVFSLLPHRCCLFFFYMSTRFPP